MIEWSPVEFSLRRSLTIVALSLLLGASGATALQDATLLRPVSPRPLTPVSPGPRFSEAAAFDVSPPLRDLAARAPLRMAPLSPSHRLFEIRPERGPAVEDRGYSGDGALQHESFRLQASALQIAAPLVSFEGLSNQDNFNTFGFRVNPPDPNGEVGPNHYVEMVNLLFGVYSKTGTLLLGPVDTGTLWTGFSVPDCTDPSGDPIVLYDQLVDRWILSQFTTSGFSDPTRPFWNCVAISVTGDPTGAYYRYAFETKNFQFFPDYPKYGVWKDSYVITTREFGPTVEYGIGVYALEKNKMVNGEPNARVVSFFLDGNEPGMLPLVGDGLLPADIDGKKPKSDVPIPIVGHRTTAALMARRSMR